MVSKILLCVGLCSALIQMSFAVPYSTTVQAVAQDAGPPSIDSSRCEESLKNVRDTLTKISTDLLTAIYQELWNAYQKEKIDLRAAEDVFALSLMKIGAIKQEYGNEITDALIKYGVYSLRVCVLGQ